ncbi:MAG: SRPBCC family protein [Candidatus Eremiobacteraeota bacterium]|nr:SRPBCC family protein [Candidatus Eremiobacteraeota bacterium]
MTDLGTSGGFAARLDAHTIRFERDLPGPIERVWSYLTESDLRATWLAPGDIPSTVGTEFGGRWEGEDGEPGGAFVFRTRVFDPPHALEIDWVEVTAASGTISDSYVRFELTAQGDRVHLVLTHYALPPAAFPTVGGGWHAHLDTLAAKLAGVEGPDADTRYEALKPEYEKLAREAAV